MVSMDTLRKTVFRGCKIQSCETFCSCGVTRNVCSFFCGRKERPLFLVHFSSQLHFQFGWTCSSSFGSCGLYFFSWVALRHLWVSVPLLVPPSLTWFCKTGCFSLCALHRSDSCTALSILKIYTFGMLNVWPTAGSFRKAPKFWVVNIQTSGMSPSQKGILDIFSQGSYKGGFHQVLQGSILVLVGGGM